MQTTFFGGLMRIPERSQQTIGTCGAYRSAIRVLLTDPMMSEVYVNSLSSRTASLIRRTLSINSLSWVQMAERRLTLMAARLRTGII